LLNFIRVMFYLSLNWFLEQINSFSWLKWPISCTLETIYYFCILLIEIVLFIFVVFDSWQYHFLYGHHIGGRWIEIRWSKFHAQFFSQWNLDRPISSVIRLRVLKNLQNCTCTYHNFAIKEHGRTLCNDLQFYSLISSQS